MTPHLTPSASSVAEHAAAVLASTKTEAQARIERAIPQGKSYDEALLRATNYARQTWNDVFAGSEDDKLDELRDYCTKLCQHNETAGKLLASEALWNM